MHQATIYVLETPCLGMAWNILHDGVGNLHIRQRPGEGNSVQHPIGGTNVVNEQRVPVTNTAMAAWTAPGSMAAKIMARPNE